MALKKRKKLTAEFNMSSLTDIIFLLLIFFMLTSSMATPNYQNLPRPKSNTKTPSPQNISLSVSPENKIFIEEKEVPEAELEQRLLERIALERKNNQEKKIEVEVTIVLTIAMTEKTGTIVKYMKLSNKLGTRLILATEPIS